MKKQQHGSFTDGQLILLGCIISALSFVMGILTATVYKLPLYPTADDTSIIKNQSEKESSGTIQDNDAFTTSELPSSTKDIILLAPSSEPLEPDTQDTSSSTTLTPGAEDEPSSSVTKEEPSVETEEEIWQNPRSEDRFDLIADREAFAKTIKDLYLNGDWNGEPMVFEGHYINLSSDGYIAADSHMLDSEENLDIPLNFDDEHPMDTCNFWYIPGKGTYIIDDETYFRCYKGEATKLGKIDAWKEGIGVDTEYHHPIIYYDEVNDKLFLWSPMIYSYKETYDYNYLYFFPDYDVAKIEFIAQVKSFDFDENGFKFTDMDGVTWRYEKQDGKDNFVSIED